MGPAVHTRTISTCLAMPPRPDWRSSWNYAGKLVRLTLKVSNSAWHVFHQTQFKQWRKYVHIFTFGRNLKQIKAWCKRNSFLTDCAHHPKTKCNPIKLLVQFFSPLLSVKQVSVSVNRLESSRVELRSARGKAPLVFLSNHSSLLFSLDNLKRYIYISIKENRGLLSAFSTGFISVNVWICSPVNQKSSRDT